MNWVGFIPLIVWFVFWSYIMIRLELVSRYRLRRLNADFDAFLRLPSFNAMLYRFWVWLLSRFEGKGAK